MDFASCFSVWFLKCRHNRNAPRAAPAAAIVKGLVRKGTSAAKPRPPPAAAPEPPSAAVTLGPAKGLTPARAVELPLAAAAPPPLNKPSTLGPAKAPALPVSDDSTPPPACAPPIRNRDPT